MDNDRIIASIDNMANNWLKDNLWLWAQCRLTREEHKGSNLKRGTSQSVDYKLQLKHYEDAGIEIVDYQYIGSLNLDIGRILLDIFREEPFN